MTTYNVFDIDKCVEEMKQQNDRLCECFGELSILSEKIHHLMWLAMELDVADRQRDCFSSLLDTVSDYVFELKQLTLAYERAVNVKTTLV